MFVLPTSIQVVVHQPISFSEVFEDSFVQIKGPFDFLNYLKYSCKASIDELFIIFLRNRIISITEKMLCFLRAIEEYVVEL